MRKAHVKHRFLQWMTSVQEDSRASLSVVFRPEDKQISVAECYDSCVVWKIIESLLFKETLLYLKIILSPVGSDCMSENTRSSE